MKKLAKIYFSEDIVSAIFALFIFICVLSMLVGHTLIGISVAGFLLEAAFLCGSVGLVCAVYKENKDCLNHNGE